jgi:hypothetical protein
MGKAGPPARELSTRKPGKRRSHLYAVTVRADDMFLVTLTLNAAMLAGVDLART